MSEFPVGACPTSSHSDVCRAGESLWAVAYAVVGRFPIVLEKGAPYTMTITGAGWRVGATTVFG